MTGREFSKRVIDFANKTKNLPNADVDFSIKKSVVEDYVHIVAEFCQDFTNELAGIINGKATNETALIIACVLEDWAKNMRAKQCNKDGIINELAYKQFLNVESISIEMPLNVD